jgi:hypothetical protein
MVETKWILYSCSEKTYQKTRQDKLATGTPVIYTGQGSVLYLYTHTATVRGNLLASAGGGGEGHKKARSPECEYMVKKNRCVCIHYSEKSSSIHQQACGFAK